MTYITEDEREEYFNATGHYGSDIDVTMYILTKDEEMSKTKDFLEMERDLKLQAQLEIASSYTGPAYIGSGCYDKNGNPLEMPYEGEGNPQEAAARQVGGDHYVKHTIEPWHVIDEYGLDFYRGNALKYLLRNKMDAYEDIEKCRHYLDKWLELNKGLKNG